MATFEGDFGAPLITNYPLLCRGGPATCVHVYNSCIADAARWCFWAMPGQAPIGRGCPTSVNVG